LLSSPLLLFSGLIFPEVPTAFLVALALFLYLKKRWGWLGLDLGLMLWMHNRNVLLVMPLLLVAAYEVSKGKKGIREVGRLGAGFLLPVAALSLYFYSIYGVLTPLGAHNEPFTSLFQLSHFWDGFFGLLLDQECGLWFHFPIFALSVTGALILWESRKRLGVIAVTTFLFYYLFMSFYENLGLTPAARYMVSVTPLLLVMTYPALETIKKGNLWGPLTFLSFLGGVLVNWLLAAVPWMRYNKLAGENMMLKLAGDILRVPLTAMEPAFQSPIIRAQSYWIAAFWVGLTLVLSFWFIRDNKKR
jgi:hypothetical protein